MGNISDSNSSSNATGDYSNFNSYDDVISLLKNRFLKI